MWRMQSLGLLDNLISLPDSAHIRESVMGECGSSTGSEAGPTAIRRNENPLTLFMIRAKLCQNLYSHPSEVAADMRSLVNESKNCNASRRSKVTILNF